MPITARCERLRKRGSAELKCAYPAGPAPVFGNVSMRAHRANLGAGSQERLDELIGKQRHA